MKISNSLRWILKSIQLSHSEHIVLYNLLHPITQLVKVLCTFSSLTIAYPNLGFNSSSLMFLVPMSSNYRSTLYHTVLCIFNSSPFSIECIILEICLLCLVSLPFLATNKDDLLSNIMRGACYGTTSGSLFRNSIFSILNFSRSINKVHATLYSLSSHDWENGTGICVKWSIFTSW